MKYKKILIGVFVFSLLFIGVAKTTEASFFSNFINRIINLKTEIFNIRSHQKASVLNSISTGDTTPRISYYPGKVNQHVDSNGSWQTDSDGSSGAGIDKLTYCQKFYPNTLSVADYQRETINSWHDAGNINNYTSTRMSYKCVEATAVTPVNGDWSEWFPKPTEAACGTGTFEQTRTCTNPSPAYGGASCSGSSSQLVARIACNQPSPINGDWSAWTNSGSCTNNIQSQTRSCTNPSPSNGGVSCVGSSSQTVSCSSSIQNTPTSDLTPRISYYSGKVNQHVDIASSTWQTDPDGSSGSGIDKLTYCKKWYPNTTSVADYQIETINSWHNGGNTGNFTSTRMSYKCIEATAVTPVNGGWSTWIDFGSCLSGQQTQTRTCANPVPANGGANCVGVSTQQVNCVNTNTSCLEQGGNICTSYEVCEGSVLGAKDSNRCCSGKCALPSNFDWRNRHGENWNSPVKNQGDLGTCTIFGGIAPIESAINLYYNQHLDVSLSEQSLICDSGLIPSPDVNLNPCGGIHSPAQNNCIAKFFGILEESCYPYKNTWDNSACVNLCPNSSNHIWKVADFIQLVSEKYRHAFALDDNNNVVYDGPFMERYKEEPLTEENLKIKLITYGPVSADSVLPGHTASIVGWNTSGGQTSWIIKNSWGTSYGDQGYFPVIKDATDFGVVGVVKTPIVPPVGKNYSILCVDKDKDNFCNWGISEEKPSSCPSNCKNEKDWDDSNPNIGALGTQTENLSGTCFSIPFTQKLGIEWINTGIEVEKLQTLLHDDGFLPDCVVDGNFGINTKLTLIAFQTTYGLDPDGIVGPLTRAKLNERWQTKCLGN